MGSAQAISSIGSNSMNTIANPLQQLAGLGESIWMDNIRRGILKNNVLAQYIEELSLTGLTSNPTIFEHAIGGSADYDDAIRRHLDEISPDAEAIFFDLAIEDLQAAADLFRPAHDRSEGADGFVSLELSPALADDTEGSIAQAVRLAERGARPNLFIKVPGTAAGAPAIEELIYRGVPINVTLLFSCDQYIRAAEAYFRGIERRLAEGKSPHVPSVASLFVSRWDKASADQLPDVLKNRLGIAVAMQTYRAYRHLYAGERWQRLAAQGARPQRLLWASTGTKDPTLPADYYVFNLTAPQTINTIPEATLLTLAGDGGRVGRPLPADGGDADAVIAATNEAGIDTEALAHQLQEEGKQQFADSYRKLLAQIESKLAQLREAATPGSARLGQLEAGVDRHIQDITENNVIQRMWAHDHTLWQNDPTEIDNRLDWLALPQNMRANVARLEAFLADLRGDGITHVLWSGMGGSSLFAAVMQDTFADISGLELIVLDSSHPDTVRTAAAALPLDHTLFVFASKAGGTLETRCHLDYFWSLNDNPRQYAVITDEGTELGRVAQAHGFRQVFFNNPNMGGRYSALSYFGLVAAALRGADVTELLTRAGQVAAASLPETPASDNPGVRLGAAIAYASMQGRDKLTLIMPPEIASFGQWLEQLIAESTGKQGLGILPVTGEVLGTPESYGNDRIFVSIGQHAGLERLADHGHPVICLPYVDRYSIGAECFRWEFATAVASHVLGINAFNQPNVEAAKKAAIEVLEQGVPDLPLSSARDALAAMQADDYLAIQAYVAIESEHERALQNACTALSDKLHAAVTFGLGPRYLHSTGQLHKGGRANGVCVQIIDDSAPDLDIPGRTYSFGQLLAAQAAGDFLALQNHNRRVFRVTLDDFLRTANTP